MKKTLTTYEVANELLADENASWTRSGALALAEYFEEYEEDSGIEVELDVVAMRCEFTECENLVEWARSYHTNNQYGEHFGDLDGDELDEAISDYILEHGQLIEFDGGIIVSEF